MCGRFLFSASEKMINQHFRLRDAHLKVEPRYNIAPGMPIMVVRPLPDDGNQMDPVLWGLVPSWAKEPKLGQRMINARSETVMDKPAFRAAFKRRRCLIPASGFYEWHMEGGHKQPYFVGLKDEPLLAFAGLWEHWVGADGSELQTATILTTQASAQMAAIHERMPLILKPGDYDAWMRTPETQVKQLLPLLQAYGGELAIYPVSTAVNNPRHEGADLIEPLAD